MPLETYNAKRDFRETDEPEGKAGRSHDRPIFVVQEHHATRLHYDFRLEAEGVLKSWSVPRGPSMDPRVKRLAVEVEDHPLAYASFAGTIPAGHYGAGRVLIWDEGTYSNLSKGQSVAEALAAGRLEFALHGNKLRGRFTLVRMKRAAKGKPQWLLIKGRDEFAESGPAASEGPGVKRPSRAGPAAPAAKPRRGGKPPGASEIDLTHPEKVLFPEAGLTKGDVFAFYDQIADYLIPFLKDRPITIERLPNGLAGPDAPHFWQKDTPEYYPSWIPRVELASEKGRTVRYALVNDRATLLYLVNQGAMTFHVWASRVSRLDHPDFVLFDLDPGKAPFGAIIEVARRLRSLLADEGFASYPKTSGKSGLHVLVPWDEPGDYDAARAWALERAEQLVRRYPRLATVEQRKANRGGRVYVDVLQNARGHHAVPPYVLRAIPRATVSTPLRWIEVKPGLDPARFTTARVIRRLRQQGSGPFDPLVETWSLRKASARRDA